MSLPIDMILAGGLGTNLKSEPDLQLSHTMGQHGDNTLSFQLCNWKGRLPTPRQRIYLRDDTYGIYWSGYVAPVSPGGFFEGAARVECRGMRHTVPDYRWETTKVWNEGTPLSTLVGEAMGKCSHVGSGVPIPAGLASLQLTDNSSDFILQNPENVFDFVKNKFNYLSTPLLWEVKQNQDHPFFNDPSFHFRFVDTAPRYFIKLTKEDEFSPTYDPDVVWNRATVGYSQHLAGEYIAQPATELYRAIPDIRTKGVSGTTELSTLAQAQALGGYIVQRNNKLRPTGGTLKIHCDTAIRAIFPVVPTTNDNVPHRIVRPNYYIRVLNDFTDWAPYDVTDFWIADVSYEYETDSLSLTLGDPIVYEGFDLQQSYQVRRIDIGAEASTVSEPLRDADAIPTYGPDKDGSTPATTGEGISIHYLDQEGDLVSTTDITKPSLPNGAAVHPNIIPDYGVQVNFGREASSIGIKGFIRVIPSKLLDWEMYHTPPPGSNTIPTDGMVVWLHNTYPFTAGNTGTRIAILTIVSTNAGATGSVSPAAIFAQGGKIGVEVVTPAATASSGFQIGLGGKKLYPHLGITS